MEHENKAAMRLSVLVGILMLAGKGGAYWVTGSAAIPSEIPNFSDEEIGR